VSDLFADLNSRRQEIRDYATQRHSWDTVGQITLGVYADFLRDRSPERAPDRNAPSASPSD
jgi:hypothetical protein